MCPLLTGAAVLLLCARGVASGCDKASVESCFNPSHPDPLRYHVLDTESEFNALCQTKMPTLTQCFAGSVGTCDVLTKLQYSQSTLTFNTYKEACKEKFSSIDKHLKCLTKVEAKTEYINCSYILEDVIKAAPVFDAMCNKANEAMRCMRKVIDDVCDTVTTRMFGFMAERAAKDILSNFNCKLTVFVDLTSGGNSVSGGVLFVVGILICISKFLILE